MGEAVEGWEIHLEGGSNGELASSMRLELGITKGQKLLKGRHAHHLLDWAEAQDVVTLVHSLQHENLKQQHEERREGEEAEGEVSSKEEVGGESKGGEQTGGIGQSKAGTGRERKNDLDVPHLVLKDFNNRRHAF
eukprot:723040-Hanusia_phi.AAC.2